MCKCGERLALADRLAEAAKAFLFTNGGDWHNVDLPTVMALAGAYDAFLSSREPAKPRRCDECDPCFSCFDGSDECRKYPPAFSNDSPEIREANSFGEAMVEGGYVPAQPSEDAGEPNRVQMTDAQFREVAERIRAEFPGSEALQARIAKLEAFKKAVEGEVRKVHRKRDRSIGWSCAWCAVPWPCPKIAALDACEAKP